MSTVDFIAFGDEPQDYGLLASPARARWSAVTADLARRWASREEDRPLANRLSGCLDKLSASLCQIGRLKNAHDHLLATACNRPKEADYAAFRGANACADFEGLLLHGRACLDRLAWLLAGQFGQRCSSFRRIRSVLAAFPKDPLATRLLEVVSLTHNRIDAIYAQIDSPDSLRDMVGHRQALTERMRTCFGVWWFHPGKALLLDCEVQMTKESAPIPIFHTSAESAQSLSFAVLDSASVLLDLAPLGLDAYATMWSPAAAVLTNYILSEPRGTPVGSDGLRFATTMTPSGFTTETRNVDPAIYSRAIATDPSAA